MNDFKIAVEEFFVLSFMSLSNQEILPNPCPLVSYLSNLTLGSIEKVKESMIVECRINILVEDGKLIRMVDQDQKLIPNPQLSKPNFVEIGLALMEIAPEGPVANISTGIPGISVVILAAEGDAIVGIIAPFLIKSHLSPNRRCA